MSEDNAAVVRSMYDAFGRGDVPAVIGALDPEVEWLEAENFLYADRNPYVGPQAVLDGVFMRLGAEWDGFAVAPAEIFATGDTVISHGHYSGAYKKTGVRIRAQYAHFFTFRAGKVVKFQQYTDTAQFLKAAGR
jgi:ketosteroid isomerase-like protein